MNSRSPEAPSEESATGVRRPEPASPSTPPPSLQASVTDRVQAASLDGLHKNLGVALATAVGTSGLLAALSARWAPPGNIWLWLGLIWGAVLFRAGVLIVQRRSAWSITTALGWFRLGVFLSGCAWGAALLLLFPSDSLEGQAVVTIVLAGMLAGTVGVYGTSQSTYLAFAAPVILSLVARFSWIGDEAHLTLSALFLIFFASLLLSTGHSRRQALRALELSFKNADVVASLESANRSMTGLNETLRGEVQERRRAEETLRGYQKSLVETVQHQTEELTVTTDRLEQEVSERKRIEQELERAEKLRALGVLAGGIAHDFNNLLAVVMANLELLSAKSSEGVEAREYAEAAEAALHQARHLTSQLLTFSRGGTPMRSAIATRPWLERAQLMVTKSPCRVEITVAPDTWNLFADPGQISQVLNNLVLNAVQAMASGGLIHLRAENALIDTDSLVPLRPGRYVLISVLDEGPGIRDGDLSRIFDPYFTDKEMGNGLGLSVCHSVITRHDGHISVRSTNEGARFDVWLPACDDATPLPQPSPSPAPSPPRLQVLVMDDNAAVQRSLIAIFRHLNSEAWGASDGTEAIAMAELAQREGSPYDLIVLDLTVPRGMGGKEAAQQLRVVSPKSKLLVSSGYSDDPVMASPEAHGFHGVLRKPYNIEKLTTLLASVLE